jgi:hypothetical protein
LKCGRCGAALGRKSHTPHRSNCGVNDAYGFPDRRLFFGGSLVKIYILLFCSLLMCASAQSQTVTPTADAATKIWEKVFKLGLGHQITVKTMSGVTYHGQISRIDDNEFEIREVDLNQKVRWYYSEISSVRGDYSRKDVFGRRHNPRNDQIITAGGVGGIMLLILLFIPKT